MDAFISGSRAYGSPSKSADIDLVIKVSEETHQKLRKLAGVADKPQDPIRFGLLNLICLTTDEDMAVWKVGTEQMAQEKPVSRDHAIKILDKLRESIGKGRYKCPSGEKPEESKGEGDPQPISELPPPGTRVSGGLR